MENCGELHARSLRNRERREIRDVHFFDRRNASCTKRADDLGVSAGPHAASPSSRSPVPTPFVSQSRQEFRSQLGSRFDNARSRMATQERRYYENEHDIKRSTSINHINHMHMNHTSFNRKWTPGNIYLGLLHRLFIILQHLNDRQFCGFRNEVRYRKR